LLSKIELILIIINLSAMRLSTNFYGADFFVRTMSDVEKKCQGFQKRERKNARWEKVTFVFTDRRLLFE